MSLDLKKAKFGGINSSKLSPGLPTLSFGFNKNSLKKTISIAKLLPSCPLLVANFQVYIGFVKAIFDCKQIYSAGHQMISCIDEEELIFLYPCMFFL